MENDDTLALLDSICMQLIAIGTAIKEIDKITNKQLFAKYPQIQWAKIAGMRDILAHHYFDLNAETIFGVCKNHIDSLKNTLEIILSEEQP